MKEQTLPDPFMGVVALRLLGDQYGTIVYIVPCCRCQRSEQINIAGDVASALDGLGWRPEYGWSRKDADPIGDGWICPQCRPRDGNRR